MKKVFLCAWLLGAVIYHAAAQQQKTVLSDIVVAPYDIAANGIISKKITLQHNATPQVKISNIKTIPVDKVPEGARRVNSFEPDVLKGLERKKPVAFVNIPAYRVTGAKAEQLVSYDLEITELDNGGGDVAARPTDVENSVLASGTWYKIGTPSRGVYKIDYSFLQSLGINPAGINPANIRVYGNGGTILPEGVTNDQPDDLIENAVFVSSTGSSFAQGDYILFYANGPVLWEKDTLRSTFNHVSNYYEDQSYYFLNFDLGPGKRISSEAATGTGTAVTSFDDYALLEQDSFNLGSIGKVWWGNKMNSIVSSNPSVNLSVTLGAVSGPVSIWSSVCNINDAGGNALQMKFNNAPTFTVALGQAPNTSIIVAPRDTTVSVNAPSGTGPIPIQFTYFPNGTGAAYINFLQFNYRRQMVFPGGQLGLRDWTTAALPAGQNASYTLQGASASLTAWDITDPLNPVKLLGTAGSGSYTFVRPGHSLHEFITFDGSQFRTPNIIAGNPIANQNLHGMEQVDLLIVTPPEFRAASEDLAAFHRQQDHIKVAVATPQEIYNEFSSGGQDIGGIRNFIRMFYKRATGETDMIKNVLFMGAASYDYKTRLAFNTNFIPTFETYESVFFNTSYSSDDYYALLDDGDDINSGDNGANLVDIGTGRIAAFTADEAQSAVDKIKHYNSPASFGPWKNVVTYIADDVDDPASEGGNMNHLNDCEQVSAYFGDSARIYNLYKLYCDAYREVSTPSGGRYPMVNKAIDDQIFNGTFLTSYSGHGSPDRWAHEAILTSDDYGAWTNKDKLPIMVTATCDFGRFDDPAHRSAGARLNINPNGGSIAMVTTTQVVYQTQNTALNRAYTGRQFSRNAAGNWRTLGEALAAGKNQFSSGADNNHKYVILGDPALKPAIPVHKVVSDKLMMMGSDTTEADTLKALGKYMLSGLIKDQQDNLLTDFNGPVYVTIFDKARDVQTVNPQADVTPSFRLQTNIVAKVKGTVVNGKFSVTFVVPKDINYDFGSGKVSYYANTDATDATGMDLGFTVGGYNDNAPADNDAPIVKPYIDDEKFRDGGVTGPNPMLYVKLYDDNGINVSGSSIGHDLVAILDDEIQTPFVMNSYYETEQNDYRKGYVHFPLYNLPEGMHTIKVRAWDAYNNSGEGTVTFEVKNKDKGFISNLYNYPNPFTDITHFVFQHNQEGENMKVTLRIFTAAGRLVKTIQQDITTTGNRTEITWDGLGEGGAPLSKGVYFYQLHAKTDKGITATAYQKLVLLR